MRKVIWIFTTFLILLLFATFIIRKNFKNSPEYNYITAKIDVQKGNVRVINVGLQKPASLDKEIDIVSEKYGFKNIFIENESSKDILKGIDNYNSVIESYLNLRNGSNWRTKYQSEIDSIIKIVSRQIK